MRAEYGTKVPLWYAAQCPLIDDGIAVIAPAGTDVLMMGVDCESGLVLWKTPNRRKWEMAHSSIVPMTLGGARTYVYAGMNGVVGVSADDGSVLWESLAWRGKMAVAASPLVAGEGRVFVSAGYGVGSMMLGLRTEKGKVIAEPLFTLKPGVFGSEQHAAVFYKGRIYGVRPNGDLCCLNADGKILWASGKGQSVMSMTRRPLKQMNLPLTITPLCSRSSCDCKGRARRKGLVCGLASAAQSGSKNLKNQGLAPDIGPLFWNRSRLGKGGIPCDTSLQFIRADIRGTYVSGIRSGEHHMVVEGDFSFSGNRRLRRSWKLLALSL